MRILVADIGRPDKVVEPVAEFLGIGAWTPPPERLIWRGHEMVIRPGISVGDALRLNPDFIFALMGWHGIDIERSKFYEYFFDRGIPVFTWGDDSNIPRLMVEVKEKTERAVHDARIVFAKPEHPILSGVRPEEIERHETTRRTLVMSVRGDIGLAYDADWNCWEIIYLEEWFGNHRWLHYHPYPCPPSRLIDNFLTYMTRPKDRTTLSMITSPTSGLVLGGITQLVTKRLDYSIGAGLIGTIIGAVAGYYFSE